MLQAPEFTSLLSKDEASTDVATFSERYGPIEVQDDPPFRKYLGSPSNGIDLLVENGVVVDVQIFVRASRRYGAFNGKLPFGLQRGMNQKDVHALLGMPAKYDEFDSTYKLDDGAIRVTVCYDDSTLKYVSIGFSLRRD